MLKLEETQKLKVIPLGGLGEIGKNMTAIEYDDELIVIDCGIAFPDEDMYGVDLVIPNIDYLINHKQHIQGIFISHGHEENVGAIAYLLKQLHTKVYATNFTISIIEEMLKQHHLTIVMAKSEQIRN